MIILGPRSATQFYGDWTMKQVVWIISTTALVLMLLACCGKKGQLIPPEALVPAAVQNLLVQQQGADFRITWQAPTREQGGRPLRDLAGFRLLRRDASTGGDCSSCPDAWRLLTAVDLDLPGETRQSGSTYIYRDRGLTQGSVSQYQLLAFSRSGGSSAATTSSPKKMLPVIPAPVVKAELLQSAIGITCTFTPPAGAQLLGFNIYRRQSGAAPVLMPLNATPTLLTTWEDQQVQYGLTYRYSATALVKIDGETVESLSSLEADLSFSLQELR